MAKVKGPLFSLGARGQLAKSLVYTWWKGIDVVRQYVIPTYTRTTDQATQRDYFKEAVGEWHTDGFTTLDVEAWDRYAGALKIAASGFNVCIKLKIKALVAEESWVKIVDVLIGTPDPAGFEITCASDLNQNLSLYYGKTKTSMFNEVEGGFDIDKTRFEIPVLTKSTKYYFYIKTTTVSGAERTGMYTFTTSAE